MLKIDAPFWSTKHHILIADSYVMYTDVCGCYSHALGEQLAMGDIYIYLSMSLLITEKNVVYC